MIQSIPVYDICSLSDVRQDDLLISRFAPYLDAHKNLFFPHRHSFYHLVLFTRGAGTHSIDFERFDVMPGQIYFMVPGQVHSWQFEGFTDGYIINFSEAFIQSFLLQPGYLDSFSFFNGNLKDAVVNLPADSFATVKELFEHIIFEIMKPAPLGSDMVRLLMLQIFIHVNRLNSNPAGSGKLTYNQTLLKNYQKLIEQHYADIKLPKDYAELLYITPNHLNAVCKDLLGLSAGELIRNRTLLEAKRLLTNPQLSISDISLRLNFSDNSYFTKFFKKTESVTPEEFRKQILKP
ncbi:AraC family transcriptional regulator [Mucilaginibacter ginsenosidivorax]|uniref:Helix-turn-helix domain-containing protein n=1 Tax=Mucilaginibacter ginsenosidivorax TaxID=862126 RepID=A0A5B8VYI6_9SPHI|nr:helix-turn-helix domain-containing protein [Mucilaginibacter ginsenosidivorax]QEC75348.1 helix-turn-helix domain-containing protein [Mucilaginibacter ginsenosidivorax]